LSRSLHGNPRLEEARMARLIYSAIMSLDGYTAGKVVYSATLQAADTARTRIERDSSPAQVRRLKEAAGHDLIVGGAHLAARAIAAGLVDQYQLFLVP